MKASTQNVNRVLADAGFSRARGTSYGYRATGSSIGNGGWMVSVSARGGDLDWKAEVLDAYTATLTAAGWDVTRSGFLLIVADR